MRALICEKINPILTSQRNFPQGPLSSITVIKYTFYNLVKGGKSPTGPEKLR